MADHASRRRRRGVALDEAILQATLDELDDVGYQRLTIDSVAARAGTSKPVIYRRWPHKASLVLAAIRWRQPAVSESKLPDTGTVRGDVVIVLGWMTERLQEVGMETLTGLLAEYGTNIPVDMRREMYERLVSIMLDILRQGVKRGEVRSDCVTPRIAGFPIAVLRHDVVINQKAITDQDIQEVVDTLFLPLVRVQD